MGNNENLELIKKVKKARKFAKGIGYTIQDLTFRYWLFDSTKLQEVIKLMTPEDEELFYCDVRKVDLLEQGRNLIYGFQRFYVKEDVPIMETGLKQIIRKN